METLDEFLAGERLEDVAIYIDDSQLGDDHNLGEAGKTVDSGIVLVIPGEAGRNAFQQATGIGAMEFAKEAMGRDGDIESTLAGGVCPDDEDGETHNIEFVLSFAEAQNEEVGGLYEEGDVIHAYAHCSCGVNFSQKWLAGSRE
ncbi:hypothetical protein halTADL_2117 [Halohasta litchfieldiae]|jgi:hypothetical protein|uniref:Uncharacterized protein n=1 Tax=Halohasta litchfieldiae TaxID=1073996 RepID=A0A1H6TNT3_9EURY|nr:DUF5807 family protein [Halohasta litchfieldiae]ATW88864.1 hypothetical protein halTADL_2117 [Halohasta litchfieldiae]SEI79844.1 hypothetical protein SAMN05444271_10878 [Halohasta litchfieldiae]